MIHRMLFNTGVRRENHLALSGPSKGQLIVRPHEVWKNDCLHIEYFLESEPPKNYRLDYLQGTTLGIKSYQRAIRIVSGGMDSKYAIFTVLNSEEK